MKNLETLIIKAQRICDACAIPYSDNITFTLYKKVIRLWGSTIQHNNGGYEIKLNPILLEDEISEKSALNTIIHELLHTCPDCMNHGKYWKYYAMKVNTLGFNIKRTETAKEKGVDESKTPQEMPKYAVRCTECGQMLALYKRNCKTIKDIKQMPQMFSCGHCHKTGTLEVKEIKVIKYIKKGA